MALVGTIFKELAQFIITILYVIVVVPLMCSVWVVVGFSRLLGLTGRKRSIDKPHIDD